MASFRSAVTGEWVSKAFAKLFPRETVKETFPRITKAEWRYIYSALDAQSGSSRNADMRAKLLAKIDGMLG